MSNIENNTATAKAERPRIVIKSAIVSVKTPCALCGQETRPAEASLDLYLEGTDSEVCVECGKKYAPEIVEALTTHWKIQNNASAAKESDEVERLRGELEGYFEKLWSLGVYDPAMWLIDYLIGLTGEGESLDCRNRKALAAMATLARREVSELVDRDCVACGATDVTGGTHFFSFRMICRKCWYHLANKWKSEGASWRASRIPADLPF